MTYCRSHATCRFATSLLLTLACTGLPIADAVAGSIPFESNGTLGAFDPTQNVLFNTDTGQYTIGSATYSGGVVVQIGVEPPSCFRGDDGLQLQLIQSSSGSDSGCRGLHAFDASRDREYDH